MLERRALLALSYPRAQDFVDCDEGSVRSLVAWLENMKVRCRSHPRRRGDGGRESARPSTARARSPQRAHTHPKKTLQIRLYPTEERKALEQVDDPAWDAAFAKYLADLECPVAAAAAAATATAGQGDGPAGRRAAALRWLLAMALSLDYRDSAAELNAAGAEMEREAQLEEEAAAARVAEAAAQAGAADSGAAAAAAARRRLAAREQAAGAFPDLDAPQVRAEIDRLLRMLRLDGAGATTEGRGGAEEAAADDDNGDANDELALLERRLAAARRAVADEVLPTVAATSSSSSAAAGASGAAAPTAAALLEGVPLGFATGDAAVDRAGALLRLLYLRDLRALQSAVDAAVVEAQEYTANPRTDASLGRVGR